MTEKQPETSRIPDVGGTSEIGTLGSELSHIAEALRTNVVRVSDLNLNPTNARRHREADVYALAHTSLAIHGQQSPVVVMRSYRGITNVVIAGGGRLLAARLLGWHWLAVVWFNGTEDEATRFALVDNRSAEWSDWSPAQLIALQAEGGVDLADLWHDDAALADLLGADVPTPTFQPEQPAYRLDELAAHCSTCTCRQGEKS